MKLLQPLPVPWMIAPSQPKLALISEENGVQLVKFCGLFGFDGTANASSESVIVDDSDLIVDPSEPSARYQLISLKFDMAGWLRLFPQYSDRQVIRETDYDWSRVSGCIRAGESIENWRARFYQEWIDRRICPNPGVYVVENSDWDVGPDKVRFNLKHFLVLGESSSIEILAKDCVWVSAGNITR